MANNTVTYTYAQRSGMCLKAALKAKKNSLPVDQRKEFRENFASSIGIGPKTLQRYCKYGINNVDTIAYIADKLGLSLRDMLSYEGEDVPFLISKRDNKCHRTIILLCIQCFCKQKETKY